MSLYCSYHPDRAGVKKCEDCGKILCMECNNVYRINHSGGKHSRGYVEKLDLCTICHSERIERKGIGSFLFLILFGIGFMSMPIWTLTQFGPSMPGFIPIFLSVFIIAGASVSLLGIKSIIKLPRQKLEAKQRKEDFLNSIEINPNINLSDEKKNNFMAQDIVEFFCQQCGTLLKGNTKFCPRCGDSTQDELELLK